MSDIISKIDIVFTERKERVNLEENSLKYPIVLTGGIATGKSTVASLFEKSGFEIIDADKITHKLLDQYSSDIASLFGEQFVENGKVIRRKLGELIFNNIDEKKRLEEFIHPLIKDEIVNQAKACEFQKKRYLIDIPLFFESSNYDDIKSSILVYTSKEIQLQRLQNRDNCDEKTALLRINNQMDIEEKRKLASYIIDNTKDLKHLKEEVERVKKELL